MVDWQQNSVQTAIIASKSWGIYNTPVRIYALHACDENQDHYLVDTGGDWTATEAGFLSASTAEASPGIFLNPDGTLNVEWVPGRTWCSFQGRAPRPDERICTYTPYPLWYRVDLLPPSGPNVVQTNAVPAGDQGQSAEYTSGVSFNIGGGVDISGDGPTAGLQLGVTWDNSVTTTVPPLIIEAGDMGPGNEGAFTIYQYCTGGDSASNCSSNIQTVGQSGLCEDFEAGQPQQGQTPKGKLSNVAQTVRWQVDPTTYGDATTFDITVTWQVGLATSTGFFWWSDFTDPNTGQLSSQYIGNCNGAGCSCWMPWAAWIDTHSLTFKVPIPSGSKCPSG